jgi:tetratricopeptide (TPR) repeat protein
VAGHGVTKVRWGMKNDKRFFPVYEPPPLPDPDGDLPESADLPPGSHLVFPRNDVFTGRAVQLHDLADALLYSAAGTGVEISQAGALNGVGGAGKTQLAVEFCYRYGRYFRGVHWLQAGDDLLAEVAACARAMGLQNLPDALPAQAEAALREWSQRGGPRLVVFDNVDGLDAPQLVQDWLGRMDGCGVRALVISRRAGWSRHLGLTALALEEMPPDEGRALLRVLAPRLVLENDGALDAVGAALGWRPLALDLAGRYIKACPALSPTGYLAEIERQESAGLHPVFENWLDEVSPTDQERRLLDIFMLSRERVTDVQACLLLRACSYAAPGVPLPRRLLEVIVGGEDGGVGSPQVDRALAELYTGGLLQMGAQGPTVHPLLADFARLEDATHARSALPALAAALEEICAKLTKSDLPLLIAPYRPHLVAAAAQTEAAGEEHAGKLWNSLGFHLEDVAEYAAAQDSHARALRIDEAALGLDHPKVAIRANNLGNVLKDMGDLPGAKENFARALQIDETVYGPDHPKVVIRINNLGSVLKDMGDLPGAKENYARALRINEAALGPDHPSVARDANNLGMVLKAMGDLPGAKEYFERALRIDEAALGPDHSSVTRDVNNLGSVLKAMGDLSGAKEYFERALRIDEAALGPDHPNVAIRVNNLGSVLKAMGDLPGAKNNYARALRIFENSLPAGHPHIEVARGNLRSLGE